MTETERRAIRKKYDEQRHEEMVKFNDGLKALNSRQRQEQKDMYARQKKEDFELKEFHKLRMYEISSDLNDELYGSGESKQG